MDNKAFTDTLWQHLDEKFTKLSQYTEAVPVDLLALYVNCLSEIKSPEEQKQMWAIVEKASKEEEQSYQNQRNQQ